MKQSMSQFCLRYRLLLGPDMDKCFVKDGTSLLSDRNTDPKKPLIATSGVAQEKSYSEA